LKAQNYNELLTGDNERNMRSSKSQLPPRFLSIWYCFFYDWCGM